MGPGHRVDAVEVGSTASTALYSRISLQLSLQHAARCGTSPTALSCCSSASDELFSPLLRAPDPQLPIEVWLRCNSPLAVRDWLFMCWSLAMLHRAGCVALTANLAPAPPKHRRCSQLPAAHVCAACAAKLECMCTCTLSVDQSVFVQYHDRVLYESIVCHKQQPFSESSKARIYHTAYVLQDYVHTHVA